MKRPKKAAKNGAQDAGDKEMLSARIKATTARQFRAHAKLKGTTVQELLEQIVTQYLKTHRI
jgi:hypothetical protein